MPSDSTRITCASNPICISPPPPSYTYIYTSAIYLFSIVIIIGDIHIMSLEKILPPSAPIEGNPRHQRRPSFATLTLHTRRVADVLRSLGRRKSTTETPLSLPQLFIATQPQTIVMAGVAHDEVPKPQGNSGRRSSSSASDSSSASGTSSSRPSSSSFTSLDGSSSSSFSSEHETPHDKTLFSKARIPSEAILSTALAFKTFLKKYPAYAATSALDDLRRSDFARLENAHETYVDYMGASIYPSRLVHSHAKFLTRHVLGNTHSVNNTSRLSGDCAEQARASVLTFFDASPDEYEVIFTANASAALKLVGEAFPFSAPGARYVLGADSHNSVHGIRKFAISQGADVIYLPSGKQGGLDIDETITYLSQARVAPNSPPALFAMTGQSNVTNAKNPMSLLALASEELGYNTLLDAAALAPTTRISLTCNRGVDAMAVSFYKMFGYPTGVGALIAKRSFLARLSRPWFAGGTVDIVQAPGLVMTMAEDVRERFEDGTINFASLQAITMGLQFLSIYQPLLPLRLSSLTRYLIESLEMIQHEENATTPITNAQTAAYPNINGRRSKQLKSENAIPLRPVVRVLSKRPAKVLQSVGDQADVGSTISLLFLDSHGEPIPNSFIEHAASRCRISLRTGCVCNPGGAAILLGLEHEMAALADGARLCDLERNVGRELGVVRISLGLASSFEDVCAVLDFARGIASRQQREAWEAEWLVARASSPPSKHA